MYDAVDIGTSGTVLLNDHVEVEITQNENVYTWEVAIQIYDDSGSNTPVTLTQNKEMGLSVAYCDNDGTGGRENFIGAVNVSEADQNTAYQNSDVFGTLTLVDNGQTSSRENIAFDQGIRIFPSHVQDYLFIGIDEPILDRLSINIFDINGRLVKNDQTLLEEIDTIRIELDYLDQGLYFVQLRNNNLNYTQIFYKN